MVYEGKEPYIFVSYAHRDADAVVPAITALQNAGYRVWYDKGIEAGTEWPEYIAEHLEACECFVAFLSENAVKSVNCRQEIHLACDINKNILVVYLEDVTLTPGMRLRLGSSQAMFKDRCNSTAQFHEQLSTARILSNCRITQRPQAETPAAPAPTPKPEPPKPAPPKPVTTETASSSGKQGGIWADPSFLKSRMVILELIALVACSAVIHRATAAGLSFWPLIGVVALPRALTTLLNYIQEMTYKGPPADANFETVMLECGFVPVTCIVGIFCVVAKNVFLKILIGLGFGLVSALAALIMVIVGEVIRDRAKSKRSV